MDPITISALVGAGSSLMSDVTGFFAQKDQNAANKALAKYQNDLLMSNWREQNEYNSPTNTMKRLTDAGINPRAYQQIGQFANADSTPQTAAPQYNSPLSKIGNYTDILNAALDIDRKLQENKNLKKQGEYIEAQTENSRALSSLNAARMSNSELDFALKTLGYDVIDGRTGMPFTQAYGYSLKPEHRGHLIKRDVEVANDAAYRAITQYYISQQMKEETENAFYGNGIDSLAKGLIRNLVRFGKWTFNTYQNSRK